MTPSQVLKEDQGGVLFIKRRICRAEGSFGIVRFYARKNNLIKESMHLKIYMSTIRLSTAVLFTFILTITITNILNKR